MTSTRLLSCCAASALALVVGVLPACRSAPADVTTDPAVQSQAAPRGEWEDKVTANNARMMEEGKRTFRWETFGSEHFWGDQLRLHQALLGEKNGGVGAGLTPRQALQLGLKVDVGAVPALLTEVLQEGAVSLDNPDTTLELLRAGAVVGVKGVFDDKEKLVSVGITCALCHSTVDDSFTKGIGRRLDGWPNRDLDVGKVAALAPNLQPFSDMLGVDTATVKKVLHSWGPGKYDAELALDGKAFRPDGKSAATLLPAAFGLAGVNLATYTGFGSLTYWNAYVANTQMHGRGTFFDMRLGDASQYPVASKTGFNNLRAGVGHPTAPMRNVGEGEGESAVGQAHKGARIGAGNAVDEVTDKLAALHFYQLAIPAPMPPEGSFNAQAAARGAKVFAGKGECARCHVPPLFTEPGYSMHTPEEIGIDDFQSGRSPTGMYRTTPLRGLFARAKGGYYHDGRFADLNAVVDHYGETFGVSFTEAERADLVEYLKSL
jgi:hypothetical protein